MKKTILFTILALLGMSQAMAEELVPLVREGVQWVNEKVIITNGDTIRYYYRYEFKGEDTESNDVGGAVNQACYYFYDEHLNAEKDSLIAGLRNFIDDDGTQDVLCYRNNAYHKVLRDKRNMLPLPMFTDGGTVILYRFGNISGENITTEFYLMCQEWAVLAGFEPFITRDNFIEVEPVEIEGRLCKRCAYLDNQGNPLAYIVEGIGFDSRDMGDLLTPFTRKPDADADYQEYWGLSHVVKDGKIIYKGMRYREDIETGIEEVETDKRQAVDGNYYNLMGQPVGKDVPTSPGIYIHNGKKICVSRMP